MHDILIRFYQPEDEAEVLKLFQLNVPKSFAQSELNDLKHYLVYERESYFVLAKDNRIIGAGGYNLLDEGREARISWDFFHPDYQGRGYGAQLLQHRLKAIKELPSVTRIVVRTSQMAHHFYAKNGFELKDVIPDYWAKGYDLYLMECTDDNDSCSS